MSPDYGLQADGYRLSDVQAQRILEMQLQRLTGLEQEKIVNEYREVMDTIADLLDILAKPERITQIISEELTETRDEFGDERRSEIVTNAEDLSMEDLIAPEDVVVTLSHSGYVKAQPLADYRAQKRGGRGKQATATKEDDFIDNLFIANTHDFRAVFLQSRPVVLDQGLQRAAGRPVSRGKPIVNLLPLTDGEKITAILPVREFDENKFVFMATANGTVKKTPLSDFSRPRRPASSRWISTRGTI